MHMSRSLLTSSFLSTSDPETEFVDQIALFAALLCGCIIVGHLLEKSRWFNQSITALLVDALFYILLVVKAPAYWNSSKSFSLFIFFHRYSSMLAGFQVKKKQFFRNFMIITSFGVVGTLTSFAIISIGARRLFPMLDIGYLEIKDYLALGAIFSTTDSVCTLQVLNQEETPLLYSLVFGEGEVNDTTLVVLFNAITKFDLSDVDLYIGLDFAANFLKWESVHSTDREVALMAYLSYITAIVFGLSGILTVFFCPGIMLLINHK
ncbi:putative cation/H+ exchanger, cation/H+ exchanger, CPA1 family [Helianthus debilis subsp. tardiflorus]